MAQDWASDVRKYVPDADDGIIAGIVRYCGIALQKRDSSLVSFSDAKETDRVRNNFLKKKLALTQADDVLDAAIAAIGARMKDDRTKNRVTVYYLLAEHFDMLQLFQKKSAAKLAPVVEAIEADDGESTTEGVASLANLGTGAKKKAKVMVDTGADTGTDSGADTGSKAIAGASELAGKAGATVVGAAGAAVAGASGVVGKAANLASDALMGATDVARKAGSVVTGAAGAAVSGVTDTAGKAVGIAGDAVSVATDLAGKAADAAGDAISDVAAAAGKAGAAVTGAAGAAVAGAAGVASMAGDKLSSAASGAMHGLKGDEGAGNGGSMRWLWWVLILIVLALVIWSAVT